TLCSCSTNKRSIYELLTVEGNSLFSEKKYSEAIEIWGKALAINSNAISLYYKCGLACIRLEDYLKAEQFFKKVIELNKKLALEKILLLLSCEPL
ncbi:MAG: tetratricopeptide repeat protein, partial [Sulfurimonas sp.]